MSDAECVELLRWALPRLGLRWAGFRKVRRQVCRRLRGRLRELGLADLGGYRRYLEQHADEWPRLDGLCRIPISRFLRDRGVFCVLAEETLPRLAAGLRGRELRCWSAGCASGEEPYGLCLLWAFRLRARFPDVSLRVVATDVEPHLLERARRARYPASSLREVPADWLERGFSRAGGELELRGELRTGVELRLQDLRREAPAGHFHLILCRNLAFTYFDAAFQGDAARRLRGRLEPGGVLVVGSHERVPAGTSGLERLPRPPGAYRRASP